MTAALASTILLYSSICVQMVRAAEDPASQAPAIRLSASARHRGENRVFQGIPTIERSLNGRLWVAWFARGEAGSPDSYVLLVTSDDEGETWSPPRLVIDPPGNVRAFDPCLWLDPDGLLWLFWAQSAGRWDGRGGVWCVTSEDSHVREPTWSEPRRLCDGVMLNKPTVHGTDERLLPVSVWATPADANIPAALRHDPGPESAANVYALRHFGRTLAKAGQVRAQGREYDEHHIVERADGSLWMLLRTPAGIMECESRDSGRSWSEPKASAIRHVDSRFSIRRLRSGNLLLITHEPPDGKTRSHLVARLSRDDGKTWQGGLMLDDRAGVSYPDATEGRDGSIFVIYDFERARARQILMAEFNEAHVLRGRPGRASRLRVLVDQASAAP